MVMHARKPQQINDGYFEKHQTHPYQNSKYSSAKGSYGSSGERYERIRDSPNGNSYRSDSPDLQSPRDRDRAYQSKGSYLQKIREKERENRDYKMSRDKYSDCARSPKDKRSRESRDSEHRTNHDRSSDEKLLLKMTSQNSSRDRKPMHNCQEKREERERLSRLGDWSEHISSSGKKYYYNCKTEVSQWEKPREWVEREQRDRDRFRKERDSSSSDSRNYTATAVGAAAAAAASAAAAAARDKHSNSRAVKRHWRDNPDTADNQPLHDPRRKHSADGDIPATQVGNHEAHASSTRHSCCRQDMDISPGDSTPTSEVSYTPSTSTATQDDLTPILLATALPRLTQQVVSPGVEVSAPSMVPPPGAGITTCNTPGPPPPSLVTLPDNQHKARPEHPAPTANEATAPATATATATDGPPTPTHSENQDCMDARKPVVVVSSSVAVSVAAVTVSAVTSPGVGVHVGGCTSSLSALRAQGPSITPSLANYYRDDLVNHVRGWPADILEKQAQKLSDEAHTMGSLHCTKVSADLKTARSIVRLTEIQATLQEQRILFLRQQIKTLEDMKSQNSFMSDDL